MEYNVALSILTLMFTYIVFSPAKVFFGNLREFTISPFEFVVTGILLCACLSVPAIFLSSIVLRLASAEHRMRLAAIVMSIGLSSFLQGTYLPWGFGALDGSRIDWSQSLFITIAGTGIWLLPLAATQIFDRYRTPQFVCGVCSILLGVQAAQLGVQFAGQPKTLPYKRFSVDWSPLLQFSRTHNAIVIILDEFQCDIFDDILNQEPELAHELTGFVFFPNTVAPSKQTFPSIPVMLTGDYYDNSMTVGNYLVDAFGTGSLPFRLRQAGVRSELYPSVPGTVYLHPSVADNSVNRQYDFREYMRTVYMGTLRSFPTWLKWQVVKFDRRRNKEGKNTHDETDGSLRAFRDLLQTTRLQSQPPTFKFIHLEGVHVPLHLDQHLNLVNVTYSRESFTRQAYGAVRLLIQLFNKLRELGVYKNSVIVVAGDHGSGRISEMWLEPSDSDNEEFNTIKARGCPLLLAKPVGSNTGSLVTSSAPATLSDVVPTILNEMGITTDSDDRAISGVPGGAEFSQSQSIFSISDETIRVRGYYSYMWEQHDPLFLPLITEFIIEGDVRDDGAWHIGRTFPPFDAVSK